VTSLTWLLLESRSSHSRKPPLSVIPELRLRQIPEPRRFLILRTSPVPLIRKRTTNSRTEAQFGYHFRVLLEDQWDVRDSLVFLHECFLLTEKSTPLRRWLTNFFINSANPTFRECKVFVQFPTHDEQEHAHRHRHLILLSRLLLLSQWQWRTCCVVVVEWFLPVIAWPAERPSRVFIGRSQQHSQPPMSALLNIVVPWMNSA
jgi:hypothetical protein